jgi:hypothetical protein
MRPGTQQGLLCTMTASGSNAAVFSAEWHGVGPPPRIEGVSVLGGKVATEPTPQHVAGMRNPTLLAITRDYANAELLVVFKTAAGDCAGSLTPVAGLEPRYETRWTGLRQGGQPYKEAFTVISENRHGRPDIIATRRHTLTDTPGRIKRIEYSCQGAACGWSYHPDPTLGYTAAITNVSPNTFEWRRRWDGDPAQETYTAYYEMPVQVCVENCPSPPVGIVSTPQPDWQIHSVWCTKDRGSSGGVYRATCRGHDQFDSIVACQRDAENGHPNDRTSNAVIQAGRAAVNAYMADKQLSECQ